MGTTTATARAPASAPASTSPSGTPSWPWLAGSGPSKPTTTSRGPRSWSAGTASTRCGEHPASDLRDDREAP